MELAVHVYHFYMCWGLNSDYFHMIGDGHQPNSRGLYIPIVGAL